MKLNNPSAADTLEQRADARGDAAATQRRLAENSTNMVTRATPDGVYVYVSSACEQVVGWRAQELMGRDGSEFAHPEDLAEVRATWAAALDGSRAQTITYRFRHREGHHVWVEATGRATRDAPGQALEIQVSTRDVTERRAAEEQLRHSEALHRTLTANLPDTAVLLLDPELRILIAEGEFARELAWFDESLLRGRTVAELYGNVPQSMLQPGLEHCRAALRGERRRFELASDGLTFDLHAVPVRNAEGHVESVVVVSRNVTQQRESERLLARRSEQQKAVARLGQLALRARDLKALMDDVVVTVSETLDLEVCAVSQLRAEDESTLDIVACVGAPEVIVGQSVLPGQTGSQAGYALRTRQPVVVEDVASESRYDTGLLQAHGMVSGMSVVIEGRDRPFGVIATHSRHRRCFPVEDVNFLTAVANVLSAVVERHREEQVSRHAALHDPLTALPNRTLALDRLDHALARRRRDGSQVAALILDLDRFKVINDSLGHRAGDELLLALAPRLRAAVRASDTVARLGGDEFVVVCDAPGDLRAVIAVAERLVAAVGQPITLSSGEHFVTASIGVAVAACGEDDAESLLRDADAAMYRAKKRGPGRYELFDDTMRAQVLTRLHTETELRRALEHGDLRVHYQPILDVISGLPVAVEALVRWEHPQQGMIAPLDFIPIAEETGLIIELGRCVLQQACAQGATWQRRYGAPIHMSVNVSGRQLAHPHFPAQVADIARRSGLQAGTLELEVTESVLIEEAGSPLTVLNQLREHGLRLALDDFGTGYSSLSYLKRFPLDRLKIDRSFTSGLPQQSQDSTIVRAIIDMSRALGLAVVAEGVETEAQLQALRELGCELAQGYLFSRPLPAHELDAFLDGHLMAASLR